jgi:uncharacterized membrane protein
MTRYELWLLLHVLAAIVWAGAALTLGVTAFAAHRFARPVELRVLAPVNAWVGRWVITPASLAALASGLLLVLDGPWTFDALWVVLGLAGFALTFLPGLVFLTPESRRLGEAMQRHGPGSPEVARRIRRILFVSRSATVVLVLVVADMVLKPTGEDGGLLVGGAVALALVLAGLALVDRAPRRAPEAEAASPR